jgi:hypothetical protein
MAMGIASLHPSYDRRTFAISRRIAPEDLQFVCPRKNRATVLEVDRRTAGLKAGAERATAFGG